MFKLNNEAEKSIFRSFTITAVVSFIALIISFFTDIDTSAFYFIAFVITGSIAIYCSSSLNKNEKKLLKEGILLKNVQVDAGDYEQSFGKLLKVVLPNNKAYAFNLTAKDISAIGDNPHVDILFDPNNPLCFIIQHEIEVIGEVEPGRVIDFTPVLTPEAEAKISGQQ
jgi:hypothetical protein